MKRDADKPADPAEPAAMGGETLSELAAEARAVETPPEEPAGEVHVMQPMQPDAGLREACKALIAGAGNLVCSRAGVDPLSAEEVENVGGALAGVAVYYLPDTGDPRVMAWVTLAFAVLGVVGPRVRQARADAAPA